MGTYSDKFNALTTNHCALIHRPLLGVPAGLHYGFLAVIKGKWQVIHLSKYGKPELVSLETFSAGQKCDIEEMRILDKEVTLQRIQKALKDHSAYKLLTNNCEDFARFIYNGKWHSKQTISAFVLVAMGLFIAFS